MTIKVAIFDLDGTITEPYFDFESIKIEMGLGADSGPVWEAMAAMPPQKREKADRILKKHEQLGVEKSTLNPTAFQALESLRNENINLAILTRNTKENAIAVLQKHALKFDYVVGREDGPVKPDAFGVIHICEYFGVRNDQAIMVGDYLFDLQCAKTAGAVAILLANTAKAKEFVEYADYVIKSLDEIPEIVKNHNQGNII